jgi:UDP-N-acetylmuramate dehydrogenase
MACGEGAHMMAVAGPRQGEGRALRGSMRLDEPLSRHTVWGIGGPADRFYAPADLDDLCAFLSRLAPDEPLFVLGLGSNLLVRDGGIRGTVVHLGNALTAIRRTGELGLRAEAGVPCPKLARFCARASLSGAEFMAGIPGTVGGALAMNAGAFGAETYDIVSHVETVTRTGERRMRPGGAFETGYRHVALPAGEWFVAGEFQLRQGASLESQARIRELLKRRADTQPTRQRSCGSVFRNPAGDFAARLIESCGLKGERIGAAEVSRKHANFIINTGDARASHVESLIERVMERVERERGVVLVPEVRIVGEPE